MAGLSFSSWLGAASLNLKLQLVELEGLQEKGLQSRSATASLAG